MSATHRQGFRSRVRASPLGRSAFLSISVSNGRTWFPPNRLYATLTLPMAGGFEAGRKRPISCPDGNAYFISPLHEDAEISPHPGSFLLGLNIPMAEIEVHAAALDARWGERLLHGDPLLCMREAAGRRFSDHVNWIARELNSRGSLLRTSHASEEADATLVHLLVEAYLPEPAAASSAPSDASVIRAEEFLTASLDQPVSLAEVARAASVGTRTLSRVFCARHGMGPMAFLRRRRLEAARRDLFTTSPRELSITEVALRYGFAHLSRFAADYRRCFGESPTETLRR
jgi:AraC-like DNA-binding protein